MFLYGCVHEAGMLEKISRHAGVYENEINRVSTVYL
jgi:hypothetical protein